MSKELKEEEKGTICRFSREGVEVIATLREYVEGDFPYRSNGHFYIGFHLTDWWETCEPITKEDLA